MPLRNLRAKALATKGRTSSGLLRVGFRNEVGERRRAYVVDGGTNIAAPTSLAAAAVGSGGTFAAGTYYWKVTATTAGGETTGSNEATATLVLNGSANLTWTGVSGAASYKVYRGTAAGAEDRLVATVTTNSYTDTGTNGSAGSVPGSNTSGSGLKLFVPGEERTVNNVPLGHGPYTYQAR